MIERDPYVQALERALLEDWGFQAHFVPDGESALRAVRELGPALLVTDILVPKVDGLTVCRRIKLTRRPITRGCSSSVSSLPSAGLLRQGRMPSCVSPLTGSSSCRRYTTSCIHHSLWRGKMNTLDRVTTGIPTLDRILGGGLPRNSLNILAGLPGTGKTVLAQQFVFANARPKISRRLSRHPLGAPGQAGALPPAVRILR